MTKVVNANLEQMSNTFPHAVKWGGLDIYHKINWLTDTFGLDAAGEIWEVCPIYILRFKHEEHLMLYKLRWS